MRILSGYNKTYYNIRNVQYSRPNFSGRNTITTQTFNNQESNKKTSNNNLKNLLWLGAIAAGIVGFAKIYPKLLIKNNANKMKNAAMNNLKKLYNETIKKYPEDERYYMQLASEAGLKAGDEYKLASIVGKSQLTDLLNVYTPRDFYLGENLSGVKNLSYKVNLHNHTVYSDGKMTIEELLEQSRKWADKIADFNRNDSKPPFVLAITDHDTLEGAKEAVKIIAANPDKYKNLKLVLGTEASMSYVNPKDVKIPLNLELVGYALNPFNRTLNNMFDNLREARITCAKNIISEINKKYPDLHLNWDEASNFHPNLSKGTSDGSIWLIRQYALFKAALKKYCAEKKKLDINKLIKPLGDDYLKKVDLKKIAEGDVESYFRTLKYGELTNIPSFSLSNSFKKSILDIRNKYVYDSSKLLKNKVILTPESFFATYKKSQDNGFWGLAHPGYLNTSMFSDEIRNYCKKHPHNDEGHHLAWRLFNHLKAVGGEKFRAYEANYQFYGNNPDRAQWIEKMNALGELPEFNLLQTGGADCHESSIFYKHDKLTPQKIAELNLCEIVEK